MYTFINF